MSSQPPAVTHSLTDLCCRAQLVSQVTPVLRAFLGWKAERDLPDLLGHLAPLVTPFLWLRLLCPGVRLPPVSPELLVQWEPPDLRESEERMVREDQQEGEESLVWPALLELPAGRDYPAGLEILGILESRVDL